MSEKESPLGKPSTYSQTYSQDLLFPVSRKLAREKNQIPSQLPFYGEDLWNAYELSWLNPKGKPELAFGEFYFPYNTPNIIESKSLKLYLNSFNQSMFESFEHVKAILEKDFSHVVHGQVKIKLYSPSDLETKTMADFQGTCLDKLDISTTIYQVHPQFLKTSSKFVEETLYTNLLKSNCLATGQPDWGSLLIRYAGPQIDHESLLKYIISYRNHSGFGEYCIEQIFCDLWNLCRPKKLTVYGRYTRRGGIDINPFRSNYEELSENTRQLRQ